MGRQHVQSETLVKCIHLFIWLVFYAALNYVFTYTTTGKWPEPVVGSPQLFTGCSQAFPCTARPYSEKYILGVVLYIINITNQFDKQTIYAFCVLNPVFDLPDMRRGLLISG